MILSVEIDVLFMLEQNFITKSVQNSSINNCDLYCPYLLGYGAPNSGHFINPDNYAFF
jgi:hypothetical protein